MQKCFLFQSRYLAKTGFLQPYFTQKDFVTSNDYPGDNLGYSFNVHATRHQQNFSSAQPIKVVFGFRPAFPAATSLIGYALLLTDKEYQFLVTVTAILI